MVPCVYAFRPMAALDLPMIRRWLRKPHVAQWWGDPDEQFALVSEDLDHPAMDQFIGEPDMIGRGHGSAFIRLFIGGLLEAGTPRIVTDPDPQNARAISAYENAGFHKERLVDTPDGRAILMVCNA